MIYNKFKSEVEKYVRDSVPDIWVDDVPAVMRTANMFEWFLKVPVYGWEEQIVRCANYMIVMYYGTEEDKKKASKYV